MQKLNSAQYNDFTRSGQETIFEKLKSLRFVVTIINYSDHPYQGNIQ